jgi:hypothetical protein
MLALSMTQPSMAQIVTRLNDLIKKLGAGVELTERRELLKDNSANCWTKPTS